MTQVPLVSTADGLAAAICHLGLAAGGRRLRVVSSRVDEALLRGKEADEEALVAALLAAGADADAVDACAIRPLIASGHELALLREGGLDAVCVGSAEEARVPRECPEIAPRSPEIAPRLHRDCTESTPRLHRDCR